MKTSLGQYVIDYLNHEIEQNALREANDESEPKDLNDPTTILELLNEAIDAYSAQHKEEE